MSLLAQLRVQLPPLTAQEALAAAEAGALLLDVREPDERAGQGLYSLAHAVPRGLLELALDPESPWLDPRLQGAEAVVCLCSDGTRAALAARSLRTLGKEAHWMEGGLAAFAEAGGATEAATVPQGPGIEGVGGVFFMAEDAPAVRAWYREVLGLDIDPAWGGVAFPWRQAADPTLPGSTVFSIFAGDSTYFGDGQPGGQPQRFMANLRVRELDVFLSELAKKGVSEVGERQVMDGFGTFAWIEDPEGRRVELWEAAAGM